MRAIKLNVSSLYGACYCYCCCWLLVQKHNYALFHHKMHNRHFTMTTVCRLSGTGSPFVHIHREPSLGARIVCNTTRGSKRTTSHLLRTRLLSRSMLRAILSIGSAEPHPAQAACLARESSAACETGSPGIRIKCCRQSVAASAAGYSCACLPPRTQHTSSTARYSYS